jgi:SOS-response transcriptional repressor LexA
MAVKEICDQWMDYVYEQWVEEWLKDSKSCLRDSTKNMVERMKNASSDSTRAEEAWNLLERLKRLSDGFNGDGMTNELKYRDEKSEIYMECALVAYKLGDLQESLNLLRVSTGSISSKYSPHKFIDYWLCGCIQWQLPSHLEDAVLSWERSMQIVNDIEKDRQNSNLLTAEKCRDIAKVMKDAINQATLSNVPPPPPDSSAYRRTSSTKFSAYEAKLKFIPFYGSVPAGNPMRALDYPIGNASVNKLELETDRFYKIYNIKQEKEIRLNPSLEYFILKANGDSMNLAKPVSIDNDDYVLLRKTNTAQDNDIVAGVVIREDASATLKRYRVESGNKFLVSESDKLDIQIPMTSEDYIQGVLIAVLKFSDDK